MSFTILLDQGNYPDYNDNILSHQGLKASWMVISSVSVHVLLFWSMFLYAPNLPTDKLAIQDYHVSLVSPKFLNMTEKEQSGPVPAPLVEKSVLPPEKDTPLQKSTEVEIALPKQAVPIKSVPLIPAKFFPDPVMPQLDATKNVPAPPMEIKTPTTATEKSGISATASVGGAGSGDGVTPDGTGFGYPYYLSSIENKIAKQWSPPPAADSTKRERAMAVVGFVIKQNGRIDTKTILIEKSSGNPFFDMAALRAVHDANPMPPLPRGLLDDLRVHFSFEVSFDS